VCFLIERDFHEIRVERVREAGGDEVGLGVVGYALSVECVLEVLECEGIVEDVNCDG